MSRLMELKIDEEYRSLLPKKHGRLKNSLEKDILRRGCRTPISVHEGTIVDGHWRYEICQKHSLPFEIEEI